MKAQRKTERWQGRFNQRTGQQSLIGANVGQPQPGFRSRSCWTKPLKLHGS